MVPWMMKGVPLPRYRIKNDKDHNGCTINQHDPLSDMNVRGIMWFISLTLTE